jgi:hypothetical protein
MGSLIALWTAVKLTQAQVSSLNSSDLSAGQIVQNPFPYDFPNMDAAPMALFPMPSCHSISLEEVTIDQLQDYESREVDLSSNSRLLSCPRFANEQLLQVGSPMSPQTACLTRS